MENVQCPTVTLSSEMVAEVLALITRQSKILNHTWSKFGEGDSPLAKDTLLGKNFKPSSQQRLRRIMHCQRLF